MKKPFHILARNHQSFHDFCLLNEIDKRDASYIITSQQLSGLNDGTLILLHGWKERFTSQGVRDIERAATRLFLRGGIHLKSMASDTDLTPEREASPSIYPMIEYGDDFREAKKAHKDDADNRYTDLISDGGMDPRNTPEDYDPIVDAVRAKMRHRSTVGIEKYGTKMTRTDLDEVAWLTHAQEEAMDLAIYLERLIQDKGKGDAC